MFGGEKSTVRTRAAAKENFIRAVVVVVVVVGRRGGRFVRARDCEWVMLNASPNSLSSFLSPLTLGEKIYTYRERVCTPALYYVIRV